MDKAAEKQLVKSAAQLVNKMIRVEFSSRDRLTRQTISDERHLLQSALQSRDVHSIARRKAEAERVLEMWT